MKYRGFTLIEVMLALIIFALTGTALMKAAADHINGVRLIEEVTFATWVANNRVTQLSLSTQWPPKNNEKGEIELADKVWFWQQSVLETNDNELRSVEITVSNDASGDNPITSVTTFIAKTSSNGLTR